MRQMRHAVVFELVWAVMDESESGIHLYELPVL